ncbi:MAG: hypothetical protein IIZ28_04520 [Erysipelotrichaceae bacterium]|nr:hypothetical protein [Erysipelotrichaceae bacterium]
MEHKYIVVRVTYTPYGGRLEEEDRVFSDRVEAEKYVQMFNSICESNISYIIKRINVMDGEKQEEDFQ